MPASRASRVSPSGAGSPARRERQVLVVSHLPQIASFADRHVRVSKDQGTAAVEVLDDARRVAELSRMLAGLERSAGAVSHAEELLDEASRMKAARERRSSGREGRSFRSKCPERPSLC